MCSSFLERLLLSIASAHSIPIFCFALCYVLSRRLGVPTIHPSVLVVLSHSWCLISVLLPILYPLARHMSTGDFSFICAVEVPFSC